MDPCGKHNRAVLSSMMDIAMGEAPDDLEELECASDLLDKLREENIANEVQSPTDFPSKSEVFTEVLDFTGEVDGGGIKMSMYDDYVNKPPMELVPQALTRAAGRALGYGANKYAPNNWRRGMRWGEVFGGLIRHLTAWNEGEDIDSKEDGGSGLSHLDHAAACLGFLCHFTADERYKEMDDRP